MNARTARVARALVAAVVSTVIAAFSHTAGGGDAPGLPTLALTVAFASLACIALSSVRLSLWRLTASVALSQAAFHGMFSITGGATLTAGHSHGAAATLAPLALFPSESAATTHSAQGMVLAHVLAAIVTIAALAHGERALLRLLELAGVRLAEIVPVVVGPLLPRRLATLPSPVRPRLRLDALGGIRHRGPPQTV